MITPAYYYTIKRAVRITEVAMLKMMRSKITRIESKFSRYNF